MEASGNVFYPPCFHHICGPEAQIKRKPSFCPIYITLFFRDVYICEGLKDKKKFVAKEISIGDEDVSSYENEVNILAMVNHPSIVRFHDSFINKSKAVIIMEYMSGKLIIED